MFDRQPDNCLIVASNIPDDFFHSSPSIFCISVLPGIAAEWFQRHPRHFGSVAVDFSIFWVVTAIWTTPKYHSLTAESTGYPL